MFRSAKTDRLPDSLAGGLDTVRGRASAAAESLAPRVEAAWETTRDKVGPLVDDAREVVVPAVGTALAEARDTVAPRVAEALQTAASASAPVRTEALARGGAALAALRGGQPAKRRWPTALGFLALGLAAGAGAGAVATRRCSKSTREQFEQYGEPVIAAVPGDGEPV